MVGGAAPPIARAVIAVTHAVVGGTTSIGVSTADRLVHCLPPCTRLLKADLALRDGLNGR
jgi:hypothetical protein